MAMNELILKSGMQKILTLFVACLMIAGFSVPSLEASVEDLSQYKNTALNTIEDWVKATGLVDLKWKAWNDYGLLVKPYFKTRYELTSNVFNAPDTDSDQTDSIFTFTPGVQMLYKTAMGVIGAAYEASFKYFAQFDTQNTQDQSFLVYANLFPTDNVYIRVNEQLEQKGTAAGSSAFDEIDYLDNRVNVVVGYRAGDWIYEFGYENFDRDFASEIAVRYNHNEDKLDYRIYRVIDDNLKVYSGIRIGWVDFSRDPSRDTTYYEIPVGMEGTLSYGVTARAAVGLHHRNLEDTIRNDLTHVVTNISLERSFFANKTSVEGGFLRRPVESTFSKATTYDEKLWYASVKHLITPTLRGRLSTYVGNRDFEERVFTGTRVIVGGRAFVVPPNQVKRDDSVFGLNVGFDYQVRKWLIFHIDYQYSRRDSNISALDYTENVFSLGSTIPL